MPVRIRVPHTRKVQQLKLIIRDGQPPTSQLPCILSTSPAMPTVMPLILPFRIMKQRKQPHHDDIRVASRRQQPPIALHPPPVVRPVQ